MELTKVAGIICISLGAPLVWAFFIALVARSAEKHPPGSTEQVFWLIPDLVPHPLALIALAGRIRPLWQMRNELRGEFISLCCGIVLFVLGVWLV